MCAFARPGAGPPSAVRVQRRRNALVTITAQLRARPHTRYTLVGGSCSGRSRYRQANGLTDPHGNADMRARPLPWSHPVAQRAEPLQRPRIPSKIRPSVRR
jgi:hypothetical protein